MIHYLLTQFKSKFLHPPTAAGNRRHGGTGAVPQAASIPPKRARLRTAFYVAAEVRGKAQRVTIHQGREWIFRKAREWSKARLGAVPCEACRSGQGCGAGRGRQPSAAGQAGRPALWAGQAEAGRLGCEASLAAASLCELQRAARVLYTSAFLSGKKEDLVCFVSPWAS